MPTIKELKQRRERRKAKRTELRRERKKLMKRARAIKQRVGKITAAIKKLGKRIVRKRERRFNTSPGYPHWGGAEDILREVVDPLVRQHRGVAPNSAKRVETYGNPGSDHHTSQVYASARDYPLVNDYAMRDIIARKLVGRTLADYENAYFTYKGVRFRVQLIAGTHGTGPHLHVGIRKA